MVADVALLIGAFAALLAAGAGLIAAFAFAAERRAMRLLLDLQFIAAMRAEGEYQKALVDFERASKKAEALAWQKGPNN